jgi:RimJ/RimL family protein N-acetyltransferase
MSLWLGRIKFNQELENDHLNFYEIGYRLREDFGGKGYGYEVAKAWLYFGFIKMNIQTIYASAHIKILGSRRILEKKDYDWFLNIIMTAFLAFGMN